MLPEPHRPCRAAGPGVPTAGSDSVAGRYTRYARLTAEKYTPWVEQVLPESVARAVDLGCGTGQCSTLLSQHADEVLAVDSSAAQLRLARATHTGSAVRFERRGVLEVTPGRDGLFGLVFSGNALFCLYAHYDPALVLTHLRALVAPGGSLVLVDVVLPTHQGQLRRRPWDIQGTAARRRLTDARAVHRPGQHPVRTQHVRSAGPLTRACYHQHATFHLPGVAITDTLGHHLIALHWRRPLQSAAAAGGTRHYPRP